MSSSLTFSTHKFFRQRLIFSTLLGKPLKIFNIRSNDLNPGLRGWFYCFVLYWLSYELFICLDYEASFLRLLEKVTNGSSVEISFTGTSIIYIPGTLSGGKVNHDCGLSKSIGWFLEFLIILAPFFKSPLRLTLSGITSNNNDISVSFFVFYFTLISNLKTSFRLTHLELLHFLICRYLVLVMAFN